MAIRVIVPGLSYIQGTDRSTVELLRTLSWYAGTTQWREGAMKEIESLVLWKSVMHVLPTALDLRNLEMLSRPIPFNIRVPINLLTWPALIADRPVKTATDFFTALNEEVFGPRPRLNMSDEGVYVIVDPHLMPPAERKDLANALHGQAVVILLPQGQNVPVELISLRSTGFNLAYAGGTISPLLIAELKQYISKAFGKTDMVIAGHGRRVFPALLAAIDLTIARLGDFALRMDDNDKRQFAEKYVGFLPDFTTFDTDWFTPGTVGSALEAYMHSFGYESSFFGADGFKPQGALTIRPYWVPVV